VAVREVLRVAEVKIRPARLDCVDLLRGIVVVVMALDHTRDFFSGLRFAPEDLAHTTGPLFFTRFVTHFCAPAFFLLAGMGGYLSLAQGKSVAEVSKFFFTRGLWLVFLDCTVVAVGWTFVFPFWFSGVLWALGWSMIVMAVLVYLPLPWVAGFGTAIVAGHNLLDGIKPEVFGNFAWLWLILDGHSVFSVDRWGDLFFVLFSVIPWVGVMALGYALGSLLRRKNWRRSVFAIGVALTVSFVILRVFHLYGNGPSDLGLRTPSSMGPWRVQATLPLTVMSFFDTLKYPASLQFLLMTLGPCLIALAWLDKVNAERRLSRILLVYGRAPLFYYVLHIYLIHFLAVWVAVACHQRVAWLLHGGTMILSPPRGYGHNLPFIYLMWILVVTSLYRPCKWFGNLKKQNPDWWWLRYL